jgi:hypothetical protein
LTELPRQLKRTFPRTKLLQWKQNSKKSAQKSKSNNKDKTKNAPAKAGAFFCVTKHSTGKWYHKSGKKFFTLSKKCGIRSYTLSNLLSSTYVDDKLKNDFLKQCETLDNDKIEPSSNLGEAIKESVFWENEFKKSAECERIAEEIFTLQVREQWVNYTEDERKVIIENYAQRIGQVFYGEREFWDKLLNKHPSIIENFEYTAKGFGVSNGYGNIAVNPAFAASPVKDYSVDKIIDTVTHEVRHEYQKLIKKDPDGFGIPRRLLNEWNQPYIPSKPDYVPYYEQDVERDARAFAALSRPD